MGEKLSPAQWYAKVCERNAMHRDISTIEIDISEINQGSGINGTKVKISEELRQGVWNCLSIGQDFGLKNDNGGYAFFIHQELLITYDPNDSSMNSVTTIRDKKAFENALKLALLGHGELITGINIITNKIYKQLADSTR